MKCARFHFPMNSDSYLQDFKNGKIGVFPTDTAYGIGCRMDNINSVERVYEIRNRPEEKALLILVSSIVMAKKYADINERVENELIDKYWPGGLTIILPCKKDMVESVVRADGETIAIRFPDHKEICGVIESIGVPIVAPSANFSGEMTPFSLSEVDPALLSKVDFIIEGMCTMKGVSTIIDTTFDSWKIVRQGLVAIKND